MRAPPINDNWASTMPDDERKLLQDAWQSYRCCRDCTHWGYDEEDGDGIGCCGAMHEAAYIVPEDWTCDRFSAKKN